jgi:hypothetical protein
VLDPSNVHTLMQGYTVNQKQTNQKTQTKQTLSKKSNKISITASKRRDLKLAEKEFNIIILKKLNDMQENTGIRLNRINKTMCKENENVIKNGNHKKN